MNPEMAVPEIERSDPSSLIHYAEACLKNGEDRTAFIAYSEAQRITPLDVSKQKQLEQLRQSLQGDSELAAYKAHCGECTAETSDKPKRYLILNNLFPPQELGGIGRKMWEWGAALLSRGHELQVLTANVPSLSQRPDPQLKHYEEKVDRSLRLDSDWSTVPATRLNCPDKLSEIAYYNALYFEAYLDRYRPDYCIIGNLDTLGNAFIAELSKRKIPTIHAIGNSTPSYDAYNVPLSPYYRLGPCSEWLGSHLTQSGFAAHPYTTLYSGGLLEQYYQYFPPKYDKLRIAYASLLIEVKGADVLINALNELHTAGVDFTCEIAGDPSRQPQYVEGLERVVSQNHLKDKIQFIGLQDSDGLRSLFARSNTLVFPSTFEEPFGKSAIEAMAAGLLLVSSATGGQPEIVEDGISGIHFQNRSYKDLADKLIQLTHDKARWQSIAKSGQKKAFAFTTSQTIHTLEQAFPNIEREATNSMPSQADTLFKKQKNLYNSCKSILEYSHGGAIEKAQQLIAELQKEAQLTPVFLLTCGKHYLHTDQLHKASEAFVNASIEAPYNWETHFFAGHVYARRQDWKLAQSYLKRALHLQPTESEIRRQLATVYQYMGNTKAAEAEQHLADTLDLSRA